MNVLGIETSCDETAASVVRDGKKVLSNVISSTLFLHKKYGGVVPEIAARGHLEAIAFVSQEAIKEAKVDLEDIGLIAVTKQPGLPGALLVGLSFARALSFSLGKDLIEVDHTQAHLYSPFLDARLNRKKPKFPLVALVVSGGHTRIFYCKGFRKIQLLGQTRDDAAGEAFDKVAKILGLSFPGGPEIDKLAKAVSRPRLHFNCARLPNSFDFSFSGIKTAVLYFVQDWQRKNPSCKLPFSLKAEIAAAFQEAVVNVLVDKTIAACKARNVKDLIIGGGVAANSLLRENILQSSLKEKIRVSFSDLEFCQDNAAMIAGLAYHLRK
ncbi:MAG: tRNA (adenosine(37)-N6)-threonylcarbamoyltransferase complex transferase subunit TsaD [Candidatus Omnitrophica bacterium]|nr:tRNA (adenosine(37)-N6)-threonylcarbamoyltransferase complex transferase subunit TsaD [Candidatus Omnitrophota bacterium]